MHVAIISIECIVEGMYYVSIMVVACSSHDLSNAWAAKIATSYSQNLQAALNNHLTHATKATYNIVTSHAYP